MKHVILGALALSLFATPAHALKLRNIDDVERTVTITYIGNESEEVTLQPNEVHQFFSPSAMLETELSVARVKQFEEWAIKDGELVLHRKDTRANK